MYRVFNRIKRVIIYTMISSLIVPNIAAASSPSKQANKPAGNKKAPTNGAGSLKNSTTAVDNVYGKGIGVDDATAKAQIAADKSLGYGSIEWDLHRTYELSSKFSYKKDGAWNVKKDNEDAGNG